MEIHSFAEQLKVLTERICWSSFEDNAVVREEQCSLGRKEIHIAFWIFGVRRTAFWKKHAPQTTYYDALTWCK